MRSTGSCSKSCPSRARSSSTALRRRARRKWRPRRSSPSRSRACGTPRKVRAGYTRAWDQGWPLPQRQAGCCASFAQNSTHGGRGGACAAAHGLSRVRAWSAAALQPPRSGWARRCSWQHRMHSCGAHRARAGPCGGPPAPNVTPGFVETFEVRGCASWRAWSCVQGCVWIRLRCAPSRGACAQARAPTHSRSSRARTHAPHHAAARCHTRATLPPRDAHRVRQC